MECSANARRRIYQVGPMGVSVPFQEVSLCSSPGRDGRVANAAVLIYDTVGPGSDPTVGLPALSREWILARGDVEEITGRSPQPRDDGRSAGAGRTTEQWLGTRVRRCERSRVAMSRSCTTHERERSHQRWPSWRYEKE